MEESRRGDPFSMVLYGITLVALSEELHATAPDLLASFYVYDATFNGPEDRSSRLMTLLLERGPASIYFPELAKSLFI